MNFIPREVTYRAWDLKERTMHYYCPLSSFGGCDSSNGKRNRHDVRSFMSWVGHQYRNGELQGYVYLQGVIKTGEGTGTFGAGWIFEGDIVEFTDIDSTVVRGFIMWNEENNRYVVIDANGVTFPLDSRVEYVLQGNVFENANLL